MFDVAPEALVFLVLLGVLLAEDAIQVIPVCSAQLTLYLPPEFLLFSLQFLVAGLLHPFVQPVSPVDQGSQVCGHPWSAFLGFGDLVWDEFLDGVLKG